MELIFLVALSIVPGIFLMLYILRHDNYEKEPIGLVIKAVLTGVLGALIAIFFEFLIGLLPIFGKGGILGAFLVSFIQVAPVEELAKLLPILWIIWKNPNFNEENDGIVYLSASALGFAMFENIFYVTSEGFAVGIIRAVTAMPLHCFTGIIMGYQVGLAKFQDHSTAARSLIIKGFLIAFLIHGTYDTLALSGTHLGILLIPLVALIIIFGKRFIDKGHELSRQRWKSQEYVQRETSATVQIQAAESISNLKTGKKAGTWKKVTGRILLLLCAILMGLIIASYFSETSRAESLTQLILGGLTMICIPVIIGILLELSYRKKRKNP